MEGRGVVGRGERREGSGGEARERTGCEQRLEGNEWNRRGEGSGGEGRLC